SCFCSDTWIEKKRQEAKEAGMEYKYDDACRDLPAELVIDNTSPFCIRIVKADDGESFVILNQDKIPTYNFSTAVDDMLNDISIVICTRDLKNDTLCQEHIRDSLEYDKRIDYRYIPQLESSVSVKSLLEQGFLPEAISNYLISLDGKNSPIRFNINALRSINKKHLKALDSKELSRYVGFADSEIGELARIYLDEVATTKELKEKISPIFSERNIPATLSKQAEVMRKVIKNAPYFDSYDAFKNYVSKESELQGEEFSTTLRLLLTNAQDGPDIAKIYKCLKNYIGEIIK
ncbi:MAG TPA: glutamate--tRNA ligase, partial [Sulfurimonas sp.]|nr:glutamate--tRNA ligase [Sulfurimonas sp.]